MRIGLVLAGGGARGAYEVGVCAEIFALVAEAHGAPPPIHVLSGSSIGSINACALASAADDLVAGATALASRWESLVLEEVLRPDGRRIWALVRALLGWRPRRERGPIRGGGVLDPAPLEALLSSTIDFARIPAQIAAGRLHAVTVTASRLPRMSPTVFVAGGPMPAEQVPYEVAPVTLAPGHALASAAIPFLFPTVALGGGLYCDGSLRQNVPLSPAIQLGCDRLVIVNPGSPAGRTVPPPPEAPASAGDWLYPGPTTLFAGALQALVVDRVDDDLARVAQLNQIVEAGTRRFGAGFLAQMNASLAEAGASPIRRIRTLEIAVSEDLGALARAHASRLARRPRSLLHLVLRRLARRDEPADAELLSYILFDGAFARALIERGRRDARARRAEILALFTPG